MCSHTVLFLIQSSGELNPTHIVYRCGKCGAKVVIINCRIEEQCHSGQGTLLSSSITNPA